MKRILIILVPLLVLSACKSKKIKVERDETAIKYAATITASDLEKHLAILASDEYEGRETGMPGQKKAAEYIQKHYETIGVPGGMPEGKYQQSFPLIVKDPRNIEMSMLKYGTEENTGRPMKIDLEYLKDFYYFGGFADTTIEKLDMVFCGYGIDDSDFDSYTMDVKGKAVIILQGQPEGKTHIAENLRIFSPCEHRAWAHDR